MREDDPPSAARKRRPRKSREGETKRDLAAICDVASSRSVIASNDSEAVGAKLASSVPGCRVTLSLMRINVECHDRCSTEWRGTRLLDVSVVLGESRAVLWFDLRRFSLARSFEFLLIQLHEIIDPPASAKRFNPTVAHSLRCRCSTELSVHLRSPSRLPLALSSGSQRYFRVIRLRTNSG